MYIRNVQSNTYGYVENIWSTTRVRSKASAIAHLLLGLLREFTMWLDKRSHFGRIPFTVMWVSSPSPFSFSSNHPPTHPSIEAHYEFFYSLPSRQLIENIYVGSLNGSLSPTKNYLHLMISQALFLVYRNKRTRLAASMKEECRFGIFFPKFYLEVLLYVDSNLESSKQDNNPLFEPCI